MLAKYFVLKRHPDNTRNFVGPEDYSVVGLGIQTLDYRNNKVLPTKGFIFATSLDFAPEGLGATPRVQNRTTLQRSSLWWAEPCYCGNKHMRDSQSNDRVIFVERRIRALSGCHTRGHIWPA